jgi:hypothetical protein
MHRLYGLVVFAAGGGFLLMGAYLLCTEYQIGAADPKTMMYVAGGCLFGYLLAIAGYKMSTGARF